MIALFSLFLFKEIQRKRKFCVSGRRDKIPRQVTGNKKRRKRFWFWQARSRSEVARRGRRLQAAGRECAPRDVFAACGRVRDSCYGTRLSLRQRKGIWKRISQINSLWSGLILMFFFPRFCKQARTGRRVFSPSHYYLSTRPFRLGKTEGRSPGRKIDFFRGEILFWREEPSPRQSRNSELATVEKRNKFGIGLKKDPFLE